MRQQAFYIYGNEKSETILALTSQQCSIKMKEDQKQVPQINRIFIEVLQSLILGMYMQQTKYTMPMSVEKMQVSEQSQSIIHPPTTRSLPFHYKTHQKSVPPFMKHPTVIWLTGIHFQNQNLITKGRSGNESVQIIFGTFYLHWFW